MEKTYFEVEVAKSYLEFKTSDISSKDKIGYLPLYIRTKWYDGAIRTYFELPTDLKDEVLRKNLDIVYPRPYLNYSKRMSKRHNVPKELAFSIIRQESAFNETARSWADAFGLMQIIPSVAEKMALKYQVKYRRMEDLYRPKTNLFLGNAVLKKMLKKNDNRFVFAIASYNASQSAVTRWKKERFKNPCRSKRKCFSEEYTDYNLEFIENVPYSETKTYLKLVIRNYINYLRLDQQKYFYFPEQTIFGREA